MNPFVLQQAHDRVCIFVVLDSFTCGKSAEVFVEPVLRVQHFPIFCVFCWSFLFQLIVLQGILYLCWIHCITLACVC